MCRGAAVRVFGMPVVLREHEQTSTGLYAEQARQWYKASSIAAVRGRAGLMRVLLFWGADFSARSCLRTLKSLSLRSSGLFRLRDMRRDGVHKRWRQAVVRWQAEFDQTTAYGTHIFCRCTGLDDRGYKCRELRRRPAGLR